MRKSPVRLALLVFALGLFTASYCQAEVSLIAVGNLDHSIAGQNTDLSGLTYSLENGVPANVLGGIGSGLAYASGSTFLAVPDRGPNAVSYNSAINDTTSWVNRFQTITMDLTPNNSGTGLPFNLTPVLSNTTLLWSLTPLVYGTGADYGVDSGVPTINNAIQHFFSGRSDNFSPLQNSGNPKDGRFDPEGIRLSNDGLSVFISDEYGPYVYQFNRATGLRVRTFRLPSTFCVDNLGADEADEFYPNNTSGRVANKGMEGLAITPDGKTLVGAMQAALIQDANATSPATKLIRLVTIDIASGRTRQFAYKLTTGSGISEILAINNHEFLVDERDGKGRGDKSNAVVKQIFKIDLEGATDISNRTGADASQYAVAKTLFLNVVTALTSNGFTAAEIPAKIEGIAFGPDVTRDGATYHTLWVANDNDFLQTVLDPTNVSIPNPNQFFVFSFTDADLGGSAFVPQGFQTPFPGVF